MDPVLHAGAQVEATDQEQCDHVGQSHHEERGPQVEPLREHRGEEGTDHESTDIEGRLATEVGADPRLIAGDDHAPGGRADHAGAEAEQDAGADPLPQVGREQHPEHARRGDGDADSDHEGGESAVGEAGECDLARESRGESGERDESDGAIGESVAIPDVGQQGEHQAVPDRHERREREQEPQRGRAERRRCGRRSR